MTSPPRIAIRLLVTEPNVAFLVATIMKPHLFTKMEFDDLKACILYATSDVLSHN